MGFLSIAVIMLAPCVFAQTAGHYHCTKGRTTASSISTTWSASAKPDRRVDRFSIANSTPQTSGTVLQNNRVQPGAPWGTNINNTSQSVDSGYPGQRRLVLTEWDSYIEPADYSSFPSYPRARSPYGSATPRISPKPAWHENLTNEEIRAKTIWTGADREDRKMQSEIVEKQLRDGPESQDAIQLAWSRAQYFLAAQKPTLAEPLLKELIVTLESHKATAENQKILGEARSKLYKLQSIKERIENPSHTRRRYSSRFTGGNAGFTLNGRAGRSRP